MSDTVVQFRWVGGNRGERVDADLNRARAGDAGAFEAAVIDLLQPAYKLALTLLRDGNQAEDAVQEATIKAWASVARLRDDNSFRAWYLTIVANECRSARRRRPWLALDTAWLHRERRPAEELVAERIDVARAVSDLGDAERLAVYLYYYLDLEVTEASRIAQISEAVFRSRLARATRRLRPPLTRDDPING